MARPTSWLVIAAALGACRFDADGLGNGSAGSGSVETPSETRPLVDEDAAQQPIRVPPAPQTDADAEVAVVECTEQGAVSANGHCYFVPDGQQDWYTARDECGSYGAHLVTVVDSAELAIVRSLAKGDIWLGLRLTGDAGAFGWITGEPFTLDAFAASEPNGTGSCAKTTDSGEWRDHSCLQPLPMLCERD